MERVTNDFIEANRDTIKCLAMNGADAAFSAAKALRTVGEDGALSLWFVYEAIVATASVLSCAPPSREFFEETFEGENKKCQCADVGGQLFLEWLDATGNRTKLSNSELVEAKEIKDSSFDTTNGVANCHWITVDGEEKTSTYDLQGGLTPVWYIVPTLNTGCCGNTPTPIPPQPYPPPYVFPIEGRDCNTNVSLIDSCVDRYGFSQNFYMVRENDGDCEESFELYFYWESINGPYIYNFYSFWGLQAKPPYAPPHPHAAPPVVQFAGNCNPGLSKVTYTLDVGCSYDPEEEDFTKKYTYDVEKTDDGIFGLARRMDALAWMINNAQLLPYTDCANAKPILEGQWVTTRWESDQKMDHSGRRLRKLFRYRTKSTRDHGQLSAYWQDFTWGAGDVCVIHKGAWWGTPQVWASSAEEGKRVIRHAAAEAGLDTDQIGGWEISGSRSPRYGMSGNMRIYKKVGFPWVAFREGADWPNTLALQGDP